MPAPTKYPQELRERAMRLVQEARKEDPELSVNHFRTVADGAGEMMLAATYAIKNGMTVDDLTDTWAPYLTMADACASPPDFRHDIACCA